MTRPAPAAAVPLVLVPALGLSQGGFPPHTWVWAGALAGWAAALAAVLSDDAGALRAAWGWPVCLTGLLAWTLLTAIWSVEPAQSVLDARRTLVYAAVLLALLLLARRRATPSLVATTHAGIAFVILYALARYLVGGHRLTFEAYLLSDPLGYANAVGIVAVLGSLLALGIVSRAPSRPARAAAAATLPLTTLALELSGSTASWLALAVGLGTAFLLDETPSRLLWAAALAAGPCAAVTVLGHESGLSSLAAPNIGGRTVAGAAILSALAAGALAAVAATPKGSWRPPRRVLVVTCVAALAVGFGIVAAYGASTRPRSLYYGVAWHDEYLAHPVLGSGAGTFGSYWNRFGDLAAWGGALDVHSLYLEMLAELGPVGLLLVLAVVLYPLRAAVTARRQPYVPAAAGAYVAFAFHAGLDWDWEMPAVVVAGLACGAAVVSAAAAERRPLGTVARGAVVAAAVLLGALAIAGARSHTVPAATADERGAPGGAPSTSPRDRPAYGLPWWPWSWPGP